MKRFKNSSNLKRIWKRIKILMACKKVVKGHHLRKLLKCLGIKVNVKVVVKKMMVIKCL